MIMYCLNPQHSHGPEVIGASEGISLIDQMVTDGTNVEARTFKAPNGANVSVFWTRDGNQGIGTLWEHTYEVLKFDVPGSFYDNDSKVLTAADTVVGRDVNCPDAYAQYDRDTEYAVGE